MKKSEDANLIRHWNTIIVISERNVFLQIIVIAQLFIHSIIIYIFTFTKSFQMVYNKRCLLYTNVKKKMSSTKARTVTH